MMQRRESCCLECAAAAAEEQRPVVKYVLSDQLNAVKLGAGGEQVSSPFPSAPLDRTRKMNGERGFSVD
jgi:hypothetical protein